MSLRSLLSKIRKQEPSLPNLKVVGGPVDIIERVKVAFMPDQSTTPRSIELRKSEDGRVYAVVSLIGNEAFSKVFKNEAEARQFYDEVRLQLLENARIEAGLIKAKLQQQFNESWVDAKTVYFHKGFKVQIYFSYNEEKAKINRHLLGLIQGLCPHCHTVQVFDAEESLKRFLESLDSVLESSEALMPTHHGCFSELSLPTRSRCPNCLSFPNVSFRAQANKGLLKKLKEKGGEEA